MHEEDDQSTVDLPAISVCHGGEEFAQVLAIELLESTFGGEARHRVKPCRLVFFIESRQISGRLIAHDPFTSRADRVTCHPGTGHRRRATSSYQTRFQPR